MRTPLSQEAARPGPVLVVQTAFIGDIVLTTPLLAALRERLGTRPITLLTTPQGADLLAGEPTVDDVIVYDKRRAGGRWERFREVVGTLRARGCTLAGSAHRSARTSAMLRAARIPRRVGPRDAVLRLLYTDLVPARRGEHEVDRNLALAEPFGDPIPIGSIRPKLHPTDDERAKAAETLRRLGIRGPYFACAPGSVWATKRWLPERFAEAINRASERYGMAGVLVGGPGDRGVARDVSRVVSGHRTADMTDRMTLRELAAVLAEARFVLGNDSAPGHIAGAVGTPAVSIFGPTVPAMGDYPYGERAVVVEHPDLGCRPCGRHGHSRCPKGHFRCMRELEVDRVLGGISEAVGPVVTGRPTE